MALYPITVNTPVEALPHIYAEDDAAIYESISGGDGVYDIGEMLKATVLSNNNVRIGNGVLSVGGHIARIKYGDYEEMTIDNGESGKNRNDLIVARFSTTGFGGVDEFSLEVKKGVAVTGAAKDPEVETGNLYEGETIREFPLHRVRLEGISIVAVDQLFAVRKTNEQLQKEVDELNRKLSVCNEIYSGVANHAQYDIPDITSYDLLVIYGGPGTYANTSVLIPVASIVYKDDGQFALGVYQGSSTFWELEFNFPSSTKINIANYKNQSWTTPAIRKILGVKL